jgi:hypothetical protein
MIPVWSPGNLLRVTLDQILRVVFNHVFREIEITLFYSGIIDVR